MWSGATNNIPSGWALCDGNNGTPNLQDKFIVGAGSSYAVDATGGSADATLVSHSLIIYYIIMDLLKDPASGIHT